MIKDINITHTLITEPKKDLIVDLEIKMQMNLNDFSIFLLQMDYAADIQSEIPNSNKDAKELRDQLRLKFNSFIKPSDKQLSTSSAK